MRESWGTRLGWAALQVGVVVALWWLVSLVDVLAIGLIATIILSSLVSPRWSNIGLGFGLFATAIALNVAYGYTQTPLILGGLGAIFAILGAYSLFSSRGGKAGTDVVS